MTRHFALLICPTCIIPRTRPALATARSCSSESEDSFSIPAPLPLLELCAILDAALAAGVKELVITGSAVSLAALDNCCWKDKIITEMCE